MQNAAQTAVVVTDRFGYRLKRAHATLRGAMDDGLREHGLTVPQYACLEMLALRPGMSNADLARATFVSRQSMNGVLRGLQDVGLIARPDTVDHGRARPATLTADGRRRLRAAQTVVHDIERRMIEGIAPERLTQLLADLDQLAQSLDP